ncbi:MAG: YcfL family protein [Campylobacterota bacterium]|nr:YcfL family protein [Campylobacterota bacterium]
MKIYSLLVALVLIFGGCAEKSYVKIVDDSVKDDIDIEDVKERVREDGLKEIQITGENDTDDYILLRYRVVWQDQDGFEIPSISSNWTDFPVHKNADFIINIIAPNREAHDYQLFINRQGD